MAHLPFTTVHKHAGDPIEYVIPVDGLDESAVAIAWWRAQGATTVGKTIGSGITVIDGATAKTTYADDDVDLAGVADDQAVLVVDIDPADTTALGIGRWPWQAAAGGIEASLVADGRLVLSKTIAAP